MMCDTLEDAINLLFAELAQRVVTVKSCKVPYITSYILKKWKQKVFTVFSACFSFQTLTSRNKIAYMISPYTSRKHAYIILTPFNPTFI